MSDAWDDEPSPNPPTTGAPISIMSRPTNQSAAVLQNLINPSAASNRPQQQSNDSSNTDEHDSSTSEPVNQLNAQMSLLMQRPGGVAKLKLLRRDPAQPAHQHQHAQHNQEPNQQKTAEQREREYEETRAAIFGGQIDGLRKSPPATAATKSNNNTNSSNNSATTNNSTPSTSTSTVNTSARIVKRQPNASPTNVPVKRSPEPTAVTSFLDEEEESESTSNIQPSAAALDQVHQHHAKRSEKSQQLQNKGKQHGGKNGGKNHRIIEEIVGNRAANSQKTQNDNMQDPDFNRHARTAPAYPPNYAPLLPYPVPAPMPILMPMPMNVGGGSVVGNSYFAAGPQQNSIGFGRGQRLNPSSSHFNPNAPVFNPNAPAFNPGYPMAQPPPPPPAFRVPNVFMGSNDPIVGPIYPSNYDNYYTSSHPPPQSDSYPDPSTVNRPTAPPATNSTDEFPSLGGQSTTTTTTAPLAGQWGAKAIGKN